MTEMIRDTLRETAENVDALAAGTPALPDFPPMGIEPGGAAATDLELQRLRSELTAAQGRISDLEHENRTLRAAAENAREDGLRDGRGAEARTLGHRVPSIMFGC